MINNIKQPKHYCNGNIQPLDYIIANNLNFMEGNIIKYITRYKYKNGLEDLKKASNYLEKLIDNFMDQKKLREELIRDEDLRLKPYECTKGKVTIGVGRNIQDRGITEDEAMYLLNNDITVSITELTSNFEWFANLSDNRKRAVINLHFNLGITKLKLFKKFLAAMADQNYKIAAEELLDSLWFKQVGDRAKRIYDIILNG